MVKSLLILVMIGLTSVSFAQDENQSETEGSKKNLVCKVKELPKKEKKLGVSVPVVQLNDEQEILNVKKFVKVTTGSGMVVELAAAEAKDDECEFDSSCRLVLAVKVNNGSLAAAYANNSSKIGFINSQVKVSCVLE